MSRSGPRTEPGGRAEAQHRLAFAEHCLGVVELIEDDGDPLSANVASAVAVLAGIAAADAACYLALGMRSRGQDHRQATDLLDQIRPGGDKASKALSRILGIKDSAQYGVVRMSRDQLVRAMRDANALVGFAREQRGG